MSTLQPYSFLVNVEAAVVNAGRYLMVVRSEQESHAADMLSFPGGKVEYMSPQINVLEETARREVREETGIEIDEIVYVESKSFVTSEGEPVVDIVLLCRYQAGDATPGDPSEVAAIEWLTAQEVLNHSKTPPWTAESIQRAERLRMKLGW